MRGFACRCPRTLRQQCYVRKSLARGFAVLSHRWVQNAGQHAESSEQRRVVVMMHGILGSKANWNTPAKRLLERIGSRGWRVLLLDHRSHGQSPVGAPPHCIDACAADVEETLQATGVTDFDEVVVCGHSFGGKVALMLAQKRLAAGACPPCMTWVLDCPPGKAKAQACAKDQSPGHVLQFLEDVHGRGPFADRAALIQTLMEELQQPVALWVAQSSKAVTGGVELSYDLSAVRLMYDDFCAHDMFDVLEDGRAAVGFVIAGRNKAWNIDTLERLERCGANVRVVRLEDSGHNVHVDDLAGLLDVLEPTFLS